MCILLTSWCSKAGTLLAKLFFRTDCYYNFFLCQRLCLCMCTNMQCVYKCGGRGSRLMDRTGRSRHPCLLDELVGSLVCLVDTNFVHFRLKDRKETVVKGLLYTCSPYLVFIQQITDFKCKHLWFPLDFDIQSSGTRCKKKKKERKTEPDRYWIFMLDADAKSGE